MYPNKPIGESVRRLQTIISEYNNSTEMEEVSMPRTTEHLCNGDHRDQ